MKGRPSFGSLWRLMAAVLLGLAVMASVATVTADDDVVDGAAQECAVLRAARRAASSTARLRQASTREYCAPPPVVWRPSVERPHRSTAATAGGALEGSSHSAPIRC